MSPFGLDNRNADPAYGLPKFFFNTSRNVGKRKSSLPYHENWIENSICTEKDLS